MTGEFEKIAAISELVESKGVVRKLGGDDIALVKLRGSIYAFINVCPHQHTPLIDRYAGQIDGNKPTCSMHGWTYDIETGKCLNEGGKLRTFKVKVEDGAVFVGRFARSVVW